MSLLDVRILGWFKAPFQNEDAFWCRGGIAQPLCWAFPAPSTHPHAMKTKSFLELADLKTIAAACEAEAVKNGWAVTIAIVDDGGHLLWLQRLDGAAPISSHIAPAKANTAGKLIPVKTAAIGYDQIPPPFNVLDTGNVEDRPRLVEAVQAKLARPSVEPGRLFRARAKTRQELLSWCGIIGAVLTVTANLSGLANVAQWAKWLFAHWLDVVSWFWKTLLFFLPQLTADDTSLLAIVLNRLVRSDCGWQPRATDRPLRRCRDRRRSIRYGSMPMPIRHRWITPCE